ncbi:unnamed protein product [Brachionus calyciflorus]|uniref:VWFA domain-containing protein n=1 Tax=Brachionus calyciflorus TaxID=104777 RepID=A0A813M0M2_9BILA|nr:unnamed protein product [Brachionus calyciflorus]
MNLFYICLIFIFLIESSKTQTTSPRPKCKTTYGSPLDGECKLVDECTGAAMKGNCANNLICCVPDIAKTVAENSFIKKSLFLKYVNNTARNNALYGFFVESMTSAGVGGNIYKAAAYFAQLVGESNYFRNLESGVIDSDTNADFGNNQTGDGSNFQGRGAILLRGRSNYQLANSQIPNLGVNIITNPERVAFPSVAFRIAAWFWSKNAYVITTNDAAKKGDLGLLADGTYHNFTLLTYSLTNNLQKLRERADIYEAIIRENGYGTLKRGLGVMCEIGEKTGYAVPICLVGVNKPYCGCEGEYETRSCPYGFYSNSKCRGSSVLKCCVEKCTSSLDIVILMDSSGSITPPNFKKEQEFVNTFLDKLTIGEDDTRVSIINYNTNVFVIADFNSTQTLESLKQKVNSINYNGGGTYTYDALKRANDVILQEKNGMRSVEYGIPKVVVVITDGISQNTQRTLLEAQKIKDRKFSVISVGVGNGINWPELIGIASTPADQYFVNDFDKIQLILAGVSRTSCQQPAPIPTETDIRSQVEKNSYKYFRYSIKDAINGTNQTLDEFTIELSLYDGDTELFSSFTDENPKSKDDFLDTSGVKPEPDTNFIEKVSNRLRRSSDVTLTDIKKRKFYQIKRPESGQNETLYFSVRGLKEKNDFRVFVYNSKVNSAFSLWQKENNKIFLFAILSCFFYFFNF